jgi:hypothetical protein
MLPKDKNNELTLESINTVIDLSVVVGETALIKALS